MSDKICFLVFLDGEEAFEIVASNTLGLTEKQLELIVDDFLQQTMPVSDYKVRRERIDKETEDE